MGSSTWINELEKTSKRTIMEKEDRKLITLRVLKQPNSNFYGGGLVLVLMDSKSNKLCIFKNFHYEFWSDFYTMFDVPN